MPKIINHWIDEGIRFDVIYTGYIGDVRQFDFILNCVSKLLNEGGIFFVDPAMADHGKLYPALNENIIEGMKLISKKADFIIPNITEACFLTNTEYLENYDKEYIYNLINKLHELGSKNVIITGVSFEKDKLGAVCSNGIDTYEYFGNLQVPSFHGTGDIFSSIVVGNIMNGKTTENSIKTAVDFVIACIKHTKEDINHSYGVKFEELLKTLK